MFVQPGDRFHSKSDGNGAANKYTIVSSAVLWGGEEGVDHCGERFLRRSFLVVREKVDIWRCRFEETFWDDFVLESSQVEKFPSITTRKRATTDRTG